MKYQTEHLEQVVQSQTLLAELFSFVGEHYDPNAQLRTDWQHFFQIWAGQLPYVKIKVFTARDDEQKIQGCVMALVLDNPLFIAQPIAHRFVELTQNDAAFDEYVRVILESL